VDIARRVWERSPVNLTNGSVNWIWQGDANDLILRSFSLAVAPASAWNLCYPQPLRVRAVAEHFGALWKRTPLFTGTEAKDALLSNPARLCARLGNPATAPEAVLRWIADWIGQGGASLNKPTRFEVRDGIY
jgi:hypothetical protein